jgi:Arc/MetJ-type ribon-helix-helix transcriptional regulator
MRTTLVAQDLVSEVTKVLHTASAEEIRMAGRARIIHEVELSDDDPRFIERMIADGRHRNADEVIDEALRHLKAHQRARCWDGRSTRPHAAGTARSGLNQLDRSDRFRPIADPFPDQLAPAIQLIETEMVGARLECHASGSLL